MIVICYHEQSFSVTTLLEQCSKTSIFKKPNVMVILAIIIASWSIESYYTYYALA